jgi:hypothetical protein
MDKPTYYGRFGGGSTFEAKAGGDTLSEWDGGGGKGRSGSQTVGGLSGRGSQMMAGEKGGSSPNQRDMCEERRGSVLSRGVAALLLGSSRPGSRGSRCSRRKKMVIDDNGCTKIPITQAILTSGKNLSQRLGSLKSFRQIFGMDHGKVNTRVSGRRVSVMPTEGNQTARAP